MTIYEAVQSEAEAAAFIERVSNGKIAECKGKGRRVKEDLGEWEDEDDDEVDEKQGI